MPVPGWNFMAMKQNRKVENCLKKKNSQQWNESARGWNHLVKLNGISYISWNCELTSSVHHPDSFAFELHESLFSFEAQRLIQLP